MTCWANQQFFQVKPLPTIENGWGKLSTWLVPEQPHHAWHDDIELKRAFGVELAKDHPNAFAAGCVVWGQDTQRALWASNNWLTDPVVLGARDAYAKAANTAAILLDKEELAAKLLKFEAEKHPNAPQIPMHESKDRLAALKLYAEVMGYIGKVDIDASTNNFVKNEMIIKFVKAEKKEQEQKIKTIEHDNNDQVDALPVKIKLVSAR